MGNLCGDKNTNILTEIARYDTAGTYSFIPDFDGVVEVYFCGAGGGGYYNPAGGAVHHQCVKSVEKGTAIAVIVGSPPSTYGRGNTSSFDGEAGLGGAGAFRGDYSASGISTLSLNLGVLKDITIPYGILTPYGENPTNGKGDTLTGNSTNATDGIVVIYKRG